MKDFLSRFLSNQKPWQAILTTQFLGFCGGLLFTLFNLPMSWFLGSIIVTTVCAMAGAKLYYSRNIQVISISVIGIILGSFITPDFFHNLRGSVLTLMLVILLNVFAITVITLYLHKLFKLDIITAFFASIPGGLSTMIALGEEAGGNGQTITIFQSLRLLTILLVLTLFMTFTGKIRPGIESSVEPIEVLQFAIIPLFIAASVLIYYKTGNLSFAQIFCMFAAGSMYYFDVLHVKPSSWIETPALVMLGSNFGSRYAKFKFREIIGITLKSVSSAIFLILLTIGAVLLFADMFSVDPLTLFFICVPGAFEMVTLISIEYHIDPLIVGFHHLMRLFLIILAIPFATKWVQSLSKKR